MVKRHVWGDEWYPVYDVDLREPEEAGRWDVLEFTDQEFAEITEVFTKFKAWQDELKDRLQASRDAWDAANPKESQRLKEMWAKARKENDEMERRRRGR